MVETTGESEVNSGVSMSGSDQITISSESVYSSSSDQNAEEIEDTGDTEREVLAL